jgi:hypothetical protein
MAWMQKTISISEKADLALANIKDVLGFSNDTDAYKFCFALAVRFDIPEHLYPGASSTKWAIGNMDENAELSDLIGSVCGKNADFNQELKRRAESGIFTVQNLVEEQYLESIPEVLDYFLSKD